jgi:hypothetical protein
MAMQSGGTQPWVAGMGERMKFAIPSIDGVSDCWSRPAQYWNRSSKGEVCGVRDAED